MRYLIPILMLAACATAAQAAEEAFVKGPVFTDYGPVADVDVTMPIPPDTVLMHSFDVSAPAPNGKPNSTLVDSSQKNYRLKASSILGENRFNNSGIYLWLPESDGAGD